MTQHAAGGTGIPHYPLVIDGRRTESWSGRSYQTIGPFLQTAWATAADGDAGDVDLAVTAARRALSEPWGKLTGLVVGGWRRLPGGCGRGQANFIGLIAMARPAPRRVRRACPAWPRPGCGQRR